MTLETGWLPEVFHCKHTSSDSASFIKISPHGSGYFLVNDTWTHTHTGKTLSSTLVFCQLIQQKTDIKIKVFYHVSKTLRSLFKNETKEKCPLWPAAPETPYLLLVEAVVLGRFHCWLENRGSPGDVDKETHRLTGSRRRRDVMTVNI